MSFDVLAILFIAFSVISSLVNKWQERRRESERQQNARRSVPQTEPDIPEMDLSEWDIFQTPEPEEPPVRPSEFREVRGTRRVSEEYTGPEFQEVRGERPVTEEDTGPEFRDPLADDEASYGRADVQRIVSEEIQTRSNVKGARGGKRRLKFDKDSLVNGILFQEILGPPRSERMPW